VELELIESVGERTMADSSRRETIYAFRDEDKPEISPELFVYCLADFWSKRHPAEQTLPFREVAVGIGSPGQVFKLPEQAIRDRLEALQRDSADAFHYHESAALQQVVRAGDCSPDELLKRVYRTPVQKPIAAPRPRAALELKENGVRYRTKKAPRRNPFRK
jgi:hypothetical protein